MSVVVTQPEGRAQTDHLAHGVGVLAGQLPCEHAPHAPSDDADRHAGRLVELEESTGDAVDDGGRAAEVVPELPALGSVAERLQEEPQRLRVAVGRAEWRKHQHRSSLPARSGQERRPGRHERTELGARAVLHEEQRR